MLTYLLKAPQAVAAKILQWAVRSWFAVFFAGQLIFASYIILLYWWSAALGRLERWNAATPHLYVKGAPLHNSVFALHIGIAALISLLGPLQLLPAIRRYAPRFHRVSGRFYIFFAFAIGIDGILLAWRKGAVGGTTDHFIISINAVIILVCAYYTIRYAIKRQLAIHNRWAVHLVLAMSGVWLFRVFLMLWLVINQGPVGFDPDTFTGPFLTTLAIAVYIFPQVIVWWYFQAKEAGTAWPKWMFSIALLCITLGMLVGVFAATMGMWLPRMKW
ncbi:Predicted membrane protein [Chitinophaga rupis]|uniref:Predicted membrane protein n=1 Tax=Chitinophaga rupis TaxID=573321 RepID=A0A1H8E0W4_9BACT|nr:Predicted membrane protein [Chitinophaga rupis]